MALDPNKEKNYNVTTSKKMQKRREDIENALKNRIH
jgi:hypothetical protein